MRPSRIAALRAQIDALIAAQSLWRKEPRLRSSVFATVENVLAGYADPGVGRRRRALRHRPRRSGWRATTRSTSSRRRTSRPASDRCSPCWCNRRSVARTTPRSRTAVRYNGRASYFSTKQGTSPRCVTYPGTRRRHGATGSRWSRSGRTSRRSRPMYGERAQTVLNNHRAKLFGTGIADEATLEYVSRLIGDERRTDVNMSGDLHGGRRSMSEHVSYGRAAPVDVLRRIRPNEAVLLYGSELPVHLRLRPWFREKRYRAG